MKRIRFLLFALLAVLAPAVAAAQDADILTGRVTGEDGQPVVGARVTALSIETEITRSVLTDKNGRYMINFPDGGGRYILRISFIGMADIVKTVVREAEEELLLTNVAMTPQAIQLEALEVTANRPPPGRGQTGEQSTELPQDLLNRLPLPDLDPNTLALLAAGVVGTALDSLSGRMGFSVAGMSDLLNQIVLDGVILGESGLQVPEEGIRRTQVTTSTFDVSRGGFAGGQVSMQSARGNNRTAGSLSYRLDNDAFQLSSSPVANAFTRHNVGGSIGGPLIRNKLFYNASFGLTRNVNHRFALAANDPLAAVRSGVDVDSISRFLSVLGTTYGFPVDGTGPYNQFNDTYSLQLRSDWNIFQRQGQSQTLALRFNTSINDVDSTRISVFDLAQHGGATESNNRLGSLTLNSRFGANWTNALAFSFSENWNEAFPYLELPEGRVRVTSDFDDGTRATNTLVFGGNRSMPTEAYRKNLQLSEDLSFLLPVRDQLHRLKVGGRLEKNRNIDRSGNNLFGSFSYNSLEDFENNLPSRYERTLTERKTSTSTVNASLYVGDTWRVSQPLEFTLGLRWDYARLEQKPAHNPAVEQAFGRRTDIDPIATSLSPRIGFSYRIPSATPGGAPKSISGGLGWFAGQTPTNVFATAYRQTGLPSSEQRLQCIGSATPIPDWDLYVEDPLAVPTTCADGSSGTPFATSAPNVTLIDPDQKLPSSLRADLSYRTRLPLNLNTTVRYTYSRGFGLWGYYDINLDEQRTFTLAAEDRTFFGDPAAIVPGTGQVSRVNSRLFPEFGGVYDVVADRASSAHQLSANVAGFLPARITFSLNYTLGFARDQGGSANSFSAATTAANPNIPEWSTGSNDRRHTLNLILSHAITPEIEITAMTRLSSGSPFTPMVDRDINGDGVANDRAFIFDPGAASDTAISNGMMRLLGAVPGRVADCLQSQFGRIAERNSCRNPWQRSLDLRASVRPNLPQLQRRLTISVDASGVLNGLDELFHGANNMKGWGESQNTDRGLLEVRGFDASSNRFLYQVNEGFGQNRRGQSALRSPFSLRISGRLAVGGQAFQNNRGFGPPVALAAGGFGGGPGGPGGGRAGGAGGLGELMSLFRGANGAVSTDSLINAAFTNPLSSMMVLKDSLGLSQAQVDKLKLMSDSLDTQLANRKAALAKALEGVNLEQLRPQGFEPFGGGRGGRGGGGDGRGRQGIGADPQLIQRLQLEVLPVLEGGRREISQTMQIAQRELTPQQWEKLPPLLRNAASQTGRRGFNATGLIDRMLANPIPVLLQLKDTLKLTVEQVSQVQAISTALDEKLTARRAELGRRFDNVEGQQQGQLFQQIQPDLEAGRKEVMDALKAVENILTSEQWKQVPERIRNPFQNQQRRGPRG